jgi:hypothetical protein
MLQLDRELDLSLDLSSVTIREHQSYQTSLAQHLCMEFQIDQSHILIRDSQSSVS